MNYTTLGIEAMSKRVVVGAIAVFEVAEEAVCD
jgi:hypothetical protein